MNNIKNELSISILNADFYNLENYIKIFRENKIKYLHMDVMDGLFVPNISFGMPIIECLKNKCSDFIFDTHLMIDKPERYIEKFIDVGSDIITFHYEATNNISECINIIKSKNVKVGISIKPDTDVEKIYKYLPNIDLILVMSVFPGFGGQKFIEDSLYRIKQIDDYIKKNNYNTIIEVDGGININNIQKLIDVGVKLFVVGSSICKGDINENIISFNKILNEE